MQRTCAARRPGWQFPVILSLLTLTAFAFAQPPDGEYQPFVAPASKEAELAIHGFVLPEGVTAELVAAEPLLANPVAFSIDERGRFFVCETFRQSKGVEDNRGHMHWLHDDLAARTVEDRLDYFKKHLGDKIQEFSREHDRIRLLEDTDGDGRADQSTVFADGFNDILDGTGAGVLAWRGDVYYTCIPKLYKLRDWTGDGVADNREVLSAGYGVRVAFRGHDLHGLVMGPDGRLYFTVGDRGYNVVTPSGVRLIRPDSGAVFRCEPDGSSLEVFCYGLRNPQELAFDDYGNLFTVDNNSDSGDQARLLYLVEGADYGWRMYYQYLEDRGPWNRERMWRPRTDEETISVQPAYILPPIANMSDGPSGLVHYPGVGLPERYRDHFFLADFRGTAGNSGIRSFALKPSGAGFELADSHQFLWKILATDVDFGYDGRMYVLDWVDGWEGIGKGRIYRFTHPEGAKAADVAAAGRIMREGFGRTSNNQLAKLLEHPDRRVRMAAQFELVDRNATGTLIDVAKSKGARLARIHAIWGIGQQLSMASHSATAESAMETTLVLLFNDPDAEIRIQAVRSLPRGRRLATGEALKTLMQADARLKLMAMMCHEAHWGLMLPDIVKALSGDETGEPLLRHAAAFAIHRSLAPFPGWEIPTFADELQQFLKQYGNDRSAHVRMAVVVALRQLLDGQLHQRSEDGGPEAAPDPGQIEFLSRAIAAYLDDTEPAIVVEAARIANDVPAEAATRDLAAVDIHPGSPDALVRRILNANFRLGAANNVRIVAAVAADGAFPESICIEALEELRLWNDLPPLDRVTGAWRPIERQQLPQQELAAAIRPHLSGILSGPPAVRRLGTRVAARYGIREVGPALVELVSDAAQDASVRVEALFALDTLRHDRLHDAMNTALGSDEPSLRSAGRRVLARIRPDEATDALKQALHAGTALERQQSIEILASLATPAADAVLLEWLNRLAAGGLPDEIQLDLLLAAEQRGTDDMKEAVARFESARRPDDHLAPYRETLAGGDADRGRDIFFGRSEVSCRRCHKVDGAGGEAGPDLSKTGAEKTREYLLEALVDPNRQIAKNYETVVLAMLDGKVYTGIIRAEDDQHLRLMTAEGAIIVVPKNEIDERAAGKSGMPADLVKHLSKSDLRDLVEYLSTLRN